MLLFSIESFISLLGLKLQRLYLIFLYIMSNSNIKNSRRKRQLYLSTIRQDNVKSQMYDYINQSQIASTRGYDLQNQCNKLKEQEKIEKAQKAFKNLHLRQVPLIYEQNNNQFSEKWQQSVKEDFAVSHYDLQTFKNAKLWLVNCILLVILIVTSWFLSVYRLFPMGFLIYPMAFLTIGVNVVDSIIIEYINWEQTSEGKEKSKAEKILFLHWKRIFICIYMVAIIIDHHYQFNCLYLIALDFVCVAFCYERSKEIHEKIKIKMLASKFRNEFQILQLLFFSLILVHSFGILLFVVSKTDAEQNWTNDAFKKIVGGPPTHYILSIYFACSTMFTVGYGDLTPKNIFEIVAIIFVQIVGIVFFSFIVNGIGVIMSKINERDEILFKNISRAEKICEKHNISQQLSIELRNHVVNNETAVERIDLDEENNFMKGLNDELRDNINNFKQINIVKSSVFFLCNWSKKFQRQLSRKLQRLVCSPGQTLPQVLGKEKIYLVYQGKVAITPNYQKRSKQYIFNTSLKTIQYNPLKEVQFNVYGYTALISGLPINLKGISKEYSTCYTVSKEDFLSIIIQNNIDLEYFHQTKEKILNSYVKQSIEAPELINPRYHYYPIYYLVLKKHKIYEEKNKRQQKLRRQRKCRRLVLNVFEDECSDKESSDSMSEGLDTKLSLENQIDFATLAIAKCPPNTKTKSKQKQEDSIILNEKERKNKYQHAKTNNSYLITKRIKKAKRANTKEFEPEQKFEQGKNFRNFFVRFNQKEVIKSYNFKFCKDFGSSYFQKNTVGSMARDAISKLLSFRCLSQLSVTKNHDFKEIR